MSAPTIVLDLDGVVWLAGEALPGSPQAVERLRSSGRRVLFVTNNSSPTLGQMVSRLGRIGIEADEADIITAAVAAASVLVPDSSAHVIGDRGVHEAVERAGVRATVEHPDAVVVGWERSFTFDGIAQAATNIRQGARFIATNDDPTHPTPEGLLPGTGALVAAIATASETAPRSLSSDATEHGPDQPRGGEPAGSGRGARGLGDLQGRWHEWTSVSCLDEAVSAGGST